MKTGDGEGFTMTAGARTSAASVVADTLARFRAGETLPIAEPVPAEPPKARKPSKRRRVEYARPNGETYYARSILGRANDVELLRGTVGDVPARNIYPLLHSEPGTGKTAAVEAAFPGLITVPGDDDTDVDAFTGQWVQRPDGSYAWSDGPLVVAAEQGRPLFIDEIALINPKVLAVVYAAMDGRGVFGIPTNPQREPVVVRPGFTVVGACNPRAPGARMSEALLSRFTLHVEYTTDYDLMKEMGVHTKVVTVAKNLAAKRANREVRWVPQARELLAFRMAEERFGLDVATANLIGVAPETDRPVVADMVSRAFGSAVAPLRTGGAAVAED